MEEFERLKTNVRPADERWEGSKEDEEATEAVETLG